jgi:D-arabinose 1-dehydrogenase-like Zn-dependent alcohol dehydrogenase
VKAVVLDRYGGPEVLSLQEVDQPKPAGRQVLVKVHACGVCRRDILIRSGNGQPKFKSRLILGHEISGEVAAMGPDVRGLSIGQRVCSTQRQYVCGCCSMCRTDRETLCPDLRFLGQDTFGGYAEYVLVGDDNLAVLPNEVDFVTGSIVACAVGTSYNAVCDTGKIRQGERVLVSGAGGLGTHAIQIARAAGAFVIATTRSADKVATLTSLGAHEVVVAKDGSFASGVRSATGGRGVDVTIDTVGGAVFHEIRRSTVPGGRIVIVGEVTGEPVLIDLSTIYRRGIQIQTAVSTSRRQLEMALRLVANGSVRPIVDRTMPLAEAAEAHRLVEETSVAGRIVLMP